MPYFVYRVTLSEGQVKQLEALDNFAEYREARTMVRDKRANKAADDDAEYRMIFAKNEVEAESLLKAPREERLIDEG